MESGPVFDLVRTPCAARRNGASHGNRTIRACNGGCDVSKIALAGACNLEVQGFFGRFGLKQEEIGNPVNQGITRDVVEHIT